MIRKIVQTGHPVLREPAKPVDPEMIGSDEFNELVNDMIETMHAAPGVGLAAPQIGLSLQLFVIEDRDDVIENMDDEYVEERERVGVPLMILVNPTLEPVGEDMIAFYEGCLSVSGFAGAVDRFHRVRVRALNERGEKVELDWTGWPARILQHEFDHLNGMLYIDRMDTRTFTNTQNLQELDELDDED